MVTEMIKTAQEIGKMIKENRTKKGMQQSELAMRLNISAQAVSKWENGDSYPDIKLIGEIADLFELTIDELITIPQNQFNKKNEYRIYEVIENKICVIEVLDVSIHQDYEIMVSVTNKTNSEITISHSNFVFLNEQGKLIEPKKNTIYNIDDDPIGANLLHRIPSFIPAKKKTNIVLIYSGITDEANLWINIPQVITNVSFVLLSKSLRNHQSHSTIERFSRNELIDFYNFNYKKGEIPRMTSDFPKISLDMMKSMIFSINSDFIMKYQHIFDSTVLAHIASNEPFLGFNFVIQHITDVQLIRDLIKKNWSIIEEDCAKLNCRIIKYEETQPFMDDEIIEKVIKLCIRLAKDYKKWMLRYINDDNIERFRSELCMLSFSRNAELFESNLKIESVNQIICDSDLSALSEQAVLKLMRYYKEKVSQSTIDYLFTNLPDVDLALLGRLKDIMSFEKWKTIRDRYIQKEKDLLDKI
jgi:transcriptional regulator with XRE-family HTH domain